MSITKRGKGFYLAFRPFGKLIYVKTDAASKSQAKQIETAILTACRSGDYRGLTPDARAACVKMYENQRWELPSGLVLDTRPKAELTLWKGCELFLNYPDIKGSSERERYASCFVHLVEYFGKDCLVRSLWVPGIKQYIAERIAAGASPSTINREKGTLSKMFQVLTELQLVEENPCRLIKNLSQKPEERAVYLSFADAQTIADHSPDWLCPVFWMGFYCGMRQGEILGLTRKRIKLSQRMVYLGPEDTKERHWKRVPIHKDLIPMLEEIMKVRQFSSDRVFLLDNEPIARHLMRPPWDKAVEHLACEAKPRFHDLRHTWRANARRSGVDPDVAEGILGHWNRGRRVNERYGYVNDEELLTAIDRMSFNHGETAVWASR